MLSCSPAHAARRSERRPGESRSSSAPTRRRNARICRLVRSSREPVTSHHQDERSAGVRGNAVENQSRSPALALMHQQANLRPRLGHARSSASGTRSEYRRRPQRSRWRPGSRWHEGGLWFCNWIDRQVVAVGLDGKREVASARGQRLMGYSIDWLPDGRLLVTGDKLRRQEPDGSMVTLAEQSANEIVVDGRGNIYINGADFNFAGGEAAKPGYIKLVTPDGELRQVADDIQFPNGMVITPDNRTLIISESFAGRLTAFDIDADGGRSNRRVFADGLGPDGICLDAEGAVWVSHRRVLDRPRRRG